MLLRLAAQIETLDDARSIFDRCKDGLAAIGLPHVTYMTVGPDRSDPVFFTTMPALYPDGPWDDPFLDYCCARYAITDMGVAFVADHPYLPDSARDLIARAEGMGFVSGLGIPVRLKGSPRFGGFILGCGLPRAEYRAAFDPLRDDLRSFCLLVHRRLDEVTRPAATDPLAVLSTREREVITLIARGMTRKECANACGLSPLTVADYTKSAYRKLNIRDRVAAARLVLGG
ncbi:transcriptional regulator, LuxR family protein [Oceaniovalibus guishaninsula JLT2003]|uniref:Transcriptional regulator, LuxR family protein n=1 Tax=Oceaniovalibus guishaninsula JLT2003 TaxID=1231392 RepID=K2HH60_9RHOB|nr:LuxR family transcriptional regulator [Oceaniovalibus guishaninsula]EKE45787.1 transcriptional regulator, LuxR family protein [Oceaniovalibus guishaninsula JLT2003]